MAPVGPVGDGAAILDLMRKSIPLTIYCTRWVPGSARIVVLGAHTKGTGALQVLEVGEGLVEVAETEVEHPIKCGTFSASDAVERRLATGDFRGRLATWDLERPDVPLTSTPAHVGLINAIDGAGGKPGSGPPEVATGGADGAVRVWDTRQHDAPVAAFLPKAAPKARDCWAVAFGDMYNDEERALLAGYDNGDLKLFDLRTNKVRWQENLGNGVCGLAFDRATVPMNKFLATTLEAQWHAYDARTYNRRSGFAKVTTSLEKGTTAWGCTPLPQNRDLLIITGGDGKMGLYKYNYPDQRWRHSFGFNGGKDSKEKEGIAGTTTLIIDLQLTDQPITGFDWHADKQGLFCCGAFDQCVRVGTVTRLNRY